MSDTAPIRRPVRSVQSRRRSASRRAVDERGGSRRDVFDNDRPLPGASVGGFFNAISQYGVNKMTTNIHAEIGRAHV